MLILESLAVLWAAKLCSSAAHWLGIGIGSVILNGLPEMNRDHSMGGEFHPYFKL